MKRSLVILAVVMFACTLLGSGVRTEQRPYRGWAMDRLSLKENLVISNDHNYYVVTVVYWKSKDQTPPWGQFWLFSPCGQANFSRPITDFFRLEVNGIPDFKLHLTKESIKPWRQGDQAGFELSLPFDGAPIRVRWFMRPDSPVLWCKLYPGPNQMVPYTNISMKLRAIPSALHKNKKGTVWSGPYRRQGVTATRTIEQGTGKIPLNNQDAYLILQDAVMDGSGQNKGQGPCIIIPGKAGSGVMTADIRNNWLLTMDTKIAPDFRDYTFGLWTRKNPISNQELLQFVRSNPRMFSAE